MVHFTVKNVYEQMHLKYTMTAHLGKTYMSYMIMHLYLFSKFLFFEQSSNACMLYATVCQKSNHVWTILSHVFVITTQQAPLYACGFCVHKDLKYGKTLIKNKHLRCSFMTHTLNGLYIVQLDPVNSFSTDLTHP